MTEQELMKSLLSSFHMDAGFGAGALPARIDLDTDGTVTLAGEVSSVAAKKRALERVAANGGVRQVVDRLRVTPAVTMRDDQIGTQLRRLLRGEPAFLAFAIEEAAPGAVPVASAQGACGRIAYRVDDGVVTLTGEVPDFVSKCLAGVMAWWVPGVRDVINGIDAAPDASEDLERAVRTVLERNPFVDDVRIRVSVAGRAVLLGGVTRSEVERYMAESDAWCVLGVEEVINRIHLMA